MQANSQRSGQLQNGKGTPRAGASNTLGQNIYQLCFPSHSASSSYLGQSDTGNYLTQFTCTIPPATSEQILTSSVQATKDPKLSVENNFNTIHTLPTGKQDSPVVLWNMPSSCQVFIPVNNRNLQGVPITNGQNVSNCAFNSLYMQQHPTSLAAGPNYSQQVKDKITGTKIPNEARQKKKKRTSLPSNLKYFSPTENAPLNSPHNSFFGGCNNPIMISEKSTVHVLSTCVHNVAAQRAVAVVTPLSPIGTAPVNVSDTSANMKMNVRPEQETVYHQPNISHPLGVSANLTNQAEEPNVPSSKHLLPKSAEPGLNDGATVSEESISQCQSASSPKVKGVVAEPNKPTELENKLSEKITNNCTIPEKKTVETEPIPVIEWPLERLHTLINMIQHLENEHQKDVHKSDAGRDIMKLYWNGDFRKFYDCVQSGIYQNIMEEVYLYGPMNEPVILRQIKNESRNKVIKEFHLLKHNEELPKMTYKSSWLNLNENVDDIDKLCGYSWFYKHFATEHESQDFASKTSSTLQESPVKSSAPCSKPLPTDVDKVPAEEPTLNKESTPNCVLAEQTNGDSNCTNSLQATIIAVKDGTSGLDDKNCTDVYAKRVVPETTNPSGCRNSPKLNQVVEEQQEVVISEIQTGSSVKTPSNNSVFLDKNERCANLPKPSQELAVNAEEDQGVKVDASTSKMDIFPHETAKLCFANKTVEDNIIAASPDKHETSLLNTPQDLNVVSLEEQVCSQGSNEFNVEEQTSCQTNTVNPLMAMTNLVRNLKQQDVSLKYRKLFEKHSGLKIKYCYSSSTLKRNNSPCIGAKSPVLSDASSQRDCTSPQMLSPEGDVLSPSAEIMLDKDSDAAVRCETDSKLGQELSVTSGEECVEMNTSASFKIQCLPHEIAKQCYAGQFMQDEDIAVPPEKIHKSSSLHRLEVLDLTNDPIRMGSFDNTSGKCSPKDSVVVQQTSFQFNKENTLKAMTSLIRAVGKNQPQTEGSNVLTINHQSPTPKSQLDELCCNGATSPDAEMDDSATFTINVLPHEVAKQCFAGQFIDDEDIFAQPEMMLKPSLLNSPRDAATTEVSTGRLSKTDGNCSNKGNVVTQQSLILNESDEESSDNECMIIDESVKCKIDTKPSEDLPVNTNEEKTDVLASIKISVLPHEMAELWFAGEMENQDFKNESAAPISTEEQIQNVEVKFENEVSLENMKPKEGDLKTSCNKLESFCCLAKWFQRLEYGNDLLCTCQKNVELSERGIENHSENPNENKLAELENSSSEITDDSENTDDEIPSPIDPTVDRTSAKKGISSSEKVCRAVAKTSEQDVSPSKCATNVTLKHNEFEKDTPDPDLKGTSSKMRLSLYGSSFEGKTKKMPTKRYKETESCEEPPETLQVSSRSRQVIKRRSKSKKSKGVESENEDAVDTRERIQRTSLRNLTRRRSLPTHPFSELGKNALSSTSFRKPFSPSSKAKSNISLGDGSKRKRGQKDATQQMSMNKYVTRGKTIPSKLQHSPKSIPKSKYELGNPALMPLQEGLSLEFKVLPESFNFEDGVEPDCTQDLSSGTQNGMSGPDEKQSKRMKTGCSTVQGVWSFSPVRKKHTQSIQATDISGSGSLFQEFKKKFHEKKDIASKKNLNSSERP